VGDDGVTMSLEPTGPLLSTLDATWSSMQTTTRGGDVLLGFTDGLIEGMNIDGVPVESEQLLAELLAIPPEIRSEPQETLERILAAMRAKSAEWTRDDITLVAIAFSD